jgi:hypothetical protein
VIGAPYADKPFATDAGAAYVFVYDGTNWVQKQKLTASDGAASDLFGSSLAIDGTVIVVGAPRADVAGSDSGAAYVFRLSGSTWVEESKLTASDAATSDNFGRAVAVKGDVVAVGAPQTDITGRFDIGSVYAYRYKGVVLLWQEEQKITSDNQEGAEYLGSSLVMKDHDTILSGAPGHDLPGGNQDAGVVYEFKHQGSSWVQTEMLNGSDSKYADAYGSVLALDGDTLLVGVPYDDASSTYDSGSVYILHDSGGRWIEEAKLTASDAGSADYFGAAISVKGNLILVGAPRCDVSTNDTGSAYLFRYVGGNCGWIEQEPKFVCKDKVLYDLLGSACALTDQGAIVAAPNRDTTTGGPDAGALELYDTGEFLLGITPTTVSAGQKLSVSSQFGIPNAPVLLAVRNIDGTPLFNILLVARFSANYDWAFSGVVPQGLGGLDVTFQSYKQSDPCRGKAIGTNQVTVHFQ